MASIVNSLLVLNVTIVSVCGEMSRRFANLIKRNKKSKMPPCTICLETTASKHSRQILGCGHVFHAKCLRELRMTTNRCPNCRRRSDVRPIY